MLAFEFTLFVFGFLATSISRDACCVRKLEW
jgi:hypothetical protein